MIQKYCVLDQESLQLLRDVSEEYGYSARVIHKLLRLARTSADLDGAENIRFQDVKAVLKCRDLDQSNSKMINADAAEFRHIKGMTQRQVQSMIENRSLDRARRIMEDCDRNHISILLKNDVRYPERAKSLEDAPAVLYYKGALIPMLIQPA